METRPNSLVLKIKESHIIPAVLVLCCGILLLAWDILSGAIFPARGIALILASIGYLLIRKRISSNLKISTSPSLLGKPSARLILNILFLIAFSYTLIRLSLRHNDSQLAPLKRVAWMVTLKGSKHVDKVNSNDK